MSMMSRVRDKMSLGKDIWTDRIIWGVRSETSLIAWDHTEIFQYQSITWRAGGEGGGVLFSEGEWDSTSCQAIHCLLPN